MSVLIITQKNNVTAFGYSFGNSNAQYSPAFHLVADVLANYDQAICVTPKVSSEILTVAIT